MARATECSEDLFDAFVGICRANPELVAKANGQPGPGADQLTREQIDYDLAVRTSPMSKALDAELSTRQAERSLLKRAEQIQVERATERLQLTEALEVAKAERPELTKRAFK